LPNFSTNSTSGEEGEKRFRHEVVNVCVTVRETETEREWRSTASAGLRDGTKVVDQILLRHADALIDDVQELLLFVDPDLPEIVRHHVDATRERLKERERKREN
jgi:hypothetical protein